MKYYYYGTEKFIEKAKQVHGDFYDYSETYYTKANNKVSVICKIHGVFEQTARCHLAGQGCPMCGMGGRHSLTKFIEKASSKHSGYYDYTLVDYSNNYTKVKIKCPSHGYFLQKPAAHLRGQGCPKCKTSLGELKITSYLLERGVEFEREKTFEDCKNESTNYKLRFDFYLPTFNMLIEYDGRQHFEPHSFGSDQSEYTKNLQLTKIKVRDRAKTEYAKRANINLLRLSYAQFSSIPAILDNLLFEVTEQGMH